MTVLTSAPIPVRAVAGLLVAGTAISLAARYTDWIGLHYVDTGKRILGALQGLSGAIKAGDFERMRAIYAADFRGTRLGLTNLLPAESKDGIHRLRFAADGAAIDRDGCIEEWNAYRATFETIGEVTMQIDALERYRSRDRLSATIRFETLGAVRGLSNAVIDRANFRFTFRDAPGGLQATSASLIDGDRYYSDRPHFADVSHSAGIDFLNQYYPDFLNQPLKFGMIRYGPGGITAVDYDNDGFYDLFIPDGVDRACSGIWATDDLKM